MRPGEWGRVDSPCTGRSNSGCSSQQYQSGPWDPGHKSEPCCLNIEPNPACHGGWWVSEPGLRHSPAGGRQDDPSSAQCLGCSSCSSSTRSRGCQSRSPLQRAEVVLGVLAFTRPPSASGSPSACQSSFRCHVPADPVPGVEKIIPFSAFTLEPTPSLGARGSGRTRER